MGDNGFTAFFEEKSEAALYAGFDSETANAKLEGTATAKIITANRNEVTATGPFDHIANADYRHYYETLCTGWKNIIGYREKEFSLSKVAFCDLCDTGATYGSQNNSGWQLRVNDNLKNAFTMALAPINDVNRMVNGLNDITKARYGEEEDQAAGAVYVLDVQALLENDVTFGEDKLANYRMWNNNLTQHDVTLLANATRLYRGARLDYVSEVLRGDVRGNGESHNVDVFTALNGYAFQHPVIPIGASSSLDFATGTLTLPALADYELYLHEVSGLWLLDNIRSGFIRRLDAPIAAANAYVLDSGDAEVSTLPTGPIIEGLTPDGGLAGWKLYWLGDTPETAADDDQMLVGLLHNEETDEVRAFRTTKAMFANDERVDVSLYLFRDSKSDRMGEEKYNVVVFDTPADEKSLVKVITNVLQDRELEMPKSLRVALRGFDIEGADYPVYSLTDHFFVMCDGTDGHVSLFDDFYTNSFDGDTFNSDYLKIEGIADNDLNITIKKDQAIWPEKSDETHATDLNGTDYIAVNGEWQEVTEGEASEGTLAA